MSKTSRKICSILDHRVWNVIHDSACYSITGIRGSAYYKSTEGIYFSIDVITKQIDRMLRNTIHEWGSNE